MVPKWAAASIQEITEAAEDCQLSPTLSSFVIAVMNATCYPGGRSGCPTPTSLASSGVVAPLVAGCGKRSCAGRLSSPIYGHIPNMMFSLIRRFLVPAVAVPLAVAGARKLSQAVEAKRGPSRGTRLLRQAADTLQGRLGRPQRRRR